VHPRIRTQAKRRHGVIRIALCFLDFIFLIPFDRESMQETLASIIVKSVNDGFRILLVVFVISIGSTAYGFELQTGLGSGFLFVENPGSTYTAPSTASATVRLSRGFLYAGSRLLTAPFLAIREGFQDSLLLLAEISLGAEVALTVRPHGTWLLGASLDGGGYLRTPGTSDRGVARRPVVGGSVRTGFATRPGWQYELAVRYRAFLDRDPVHSIEPSFAVLYLISPRAGEAE
jgi:hypothetical protein